MSTFIIAEAGVNHNGSAERALEMVTVAARCGADAVKFQTFSADRLVKPGSAKAEYQKRETGEGDQHSMLQALEMSPELHRKLIDRCHECGIEFMSTPFDEDAALFLKKIGMKTLKVPSGEITNFPFLRFLTSLETPMILSTGMSELAEVEAAISCIREAAVRQGRPPLGHNELKILHCTSNYPAAAVDVNLRAMVEMGDRLGFPVGYSDHTLGIAVSTAAVAMGAVVIEKHFTLDRSLPGPDHRASLTPDELAALVDQIRTVELSLGSPVKAPAPSELAVRQLVRRSIFAARDIESDTAIQMPDLEMLRPADGISPSEIDKVEGRKTKRRIAAGQMIRWDDLS